MPEGLELTTGHDDFDEVGRRLRHQGGTLTDRIRGNLIGAVRPTTADVQRSLRGGLPKRGGLAERLARTTVSARARNEGAGGVAVRVTVEQGDTDLQAIDEGTVYHPVFGHGPLVRQRIRSGLISTPLAALGDRARDAVSKAMDDVAHDITK